jgi:DNA-binding transcriptional LysR family regulator
MLDEDTAVAAGVAGLSVARLPDFVVADLLASGSLARLNDGRTGEPIAIVARCRADANLVARRLVDALATAFS